MPAAGSSAVTPPAAWAFQESGKLCFLIEPLSARWGRLNADKGVLRDANEGYTVRTRDRDLKGTTLKGDGWSATLNAGWVVRPAARPGSFAIVRVISINHATARKKYPGEFPAHAAPSHSGMPQIPTSP